MLVYLGIIACIPIFGSNGQQPCSTTPGSQAECITLNKCRFFLDLLKQPDTLPATKAEVLKKSHCGFEGTTPKVCCPNVAQTATAETAIPDPPDVSNHPNLRLINDPNCGPVTESKITHGSKTEISEFPWMVLIAVNVTGQNSPLFSCGGALITKRYVLTAAHCVSNLPSRITLSGVRLGEHNLATELDCEEEEGVQVRCADKYQDFLIESVLAHGDYVKKSHQNDVALIRMNRDADFGSANVRPICLPVGDAANLTSNKVIVSGWGTTEIGTRSEVLLQVKLRIAPNDECARIYRENHGVNVTYKQLCAGGHDGRDSCAGDSGGPLQYPANVKGVPKYVQYGVINFGPALCGQVGYPGVYLKVAYYMDWILDNITE